MSQLLEEVVNDPDARMTRPDDHCRPSTASLPSTGSPALDSEQETGQKSDSDSEILPLASSPEPEVEVEVNRLWQSYTIAEVLLLAKQLKAGKMVADLVLPGRGTVSIRHRVSLLERGVLRWHPDMSSSSRRAIQKVLSILYDSNIMDRARIRNKPRWEFAELVKLFDAINEDGQTLEGVIDRLPHRSVDTILAKMRQVLRESIPLHPDYTIEKKQEVNVLRQKLPQTDVLEAMAGTPARRPRDRANFTEHDDDIPLQVFREQSTTVTEGCRLLERNPVAMFKRFLKLRRAMSDLAAVTEASDSGSESESEEEIDSAVEGDCEAEDQQSSSSYRYWTTEELERLTKLRFEDKLEWELVAADLNRTAKSCEAKWRSRSKTYTRSTSDNHPASDGDNQGEEQSAPTRKSRTYRRWTEIETQELVKFRTEQSKESLNLIAEQLGRSVVSVKAYWKKLVRREELSDSRRERDGDAASLEYKDNQVEGSGEASSEARGETNPTIDAMDLDAEMQGVDDLTVRRDNSPQTAVPGDQGGLNQEVDAADIEMGDADDSMVRMDDSNVETHFIVAAGRPTKWDLWI